MSLSLSKKKATLPTVLDNSNLPKKVSRMKLSKKEPAEKRNTIENNTKVLTEQTSCNTDKTEKSNKIIKRINDKPKDVEKVNVGKILEDDGEVEVRKSIRNENSIQLDSAVPAYKKNTDTTESIDPLLKKRSREKSLANLSSKKLKTLLVNHSHPQKETRHFPTEQQDEHFDERKPLGPTTTFNKNIIILSDDDDDDTYGTYGEPALHTLQLSKKTNRNKLSLSKKKRHS